VQIHIEGDQVAGVSLHSIEWPASIPATFVDAKHALYSYKQFADNNGSRADLGERSCPFCHSTTRLPILLLHFCKAILGHAEVGKRLVEVVVNVVFTRRHFLQCPTNIVM